MSNTNAKNDWKEREIGALWEKKSQAGNTMLTGKINDVPVIIMVNKFKSENPNAPDYRVYKSEEKGRPQQASPAPTKAKSQKAPPTPPPDTPASEDVDF